MGFCLIGLFLPNLGYATTDPDAKAIVKQQQVPQVWIFDYHMSSYSAAVCLVSTRNGLSKLEDTYLHPRIPHNPWIRWTTSVANNLTNDLMMLAEHEVYGHGFRHRSHGLQVEGYTLFLLFPWAPFFVPMNGLGAATYYNSSKTADTDILETIAGNEANSVLASELIRANFSLGYLDHRSFNLFFKAFTNLLGYIIITPEEVNQSDMPGDIEVYLEDINKKHGFKGLHLYELRRASWVFYLNPILYTSVWSFYSYIFTGKKEFDIPRLTWDQVSYMPLIRMGLTPFGVAYYLDNYLSISQKTFLISLNGGSSPFYTSSYGGIGCQTSELWTYQNYGLGLEGNLWYQPQLQLSPSDPLSAHNEWGGLMGITNRYRVNEHVSLLATVYYKTTGFVEGVLAGSGLGLRAGISLHN